MLLLHTTPESEIINLASGYQLISSNTFIFCSWGKSVFLYHTLIDQKIFLSSHCYILQILYRSCTLPVRLYHLQGGSDIIIIFNKNAAFGKFSMRLWIHSYSRYLTCHTVIRHCTIFDCYYFTVHVISFPQWNWYQEYFFLYCLQMTRDLTVLSFGGQHQGEVFHF